MGILKSVEKDSQQVPFLKETDLVTFIYKIALDGKFQVSAWPDRDYLMTVWLFVAAMYSW